MSQVIWGRIRKARKISIKRNWSNRIRKPANYAASHSQVCYGAFLLETSEIAPVQLYVFANDGYYPEPGYNGMSAIAL